MCMHFLCILNVGGWMIGGEWWVGGGIQHPESGIIIMIMASSRVLNYYLVHFYSCVSTTQVRLGL